MQKLIEINTLEVAGLRWASAACRLSHQSIGDNGGAKDVGLLSRLAKAGDEHAKALRGIMVWVSIKAPRYFWHEFVTYRMGCEQLGSESTMHGCSESFNEGVDPILLEIYKQIKKDEPENIQLIKSNLPEGMMQERIFCINYQALRRMYFQRRYHRLPEWAEFVKWLKTLPYAAELVMVENV